MVFCKKIKADIKIIYIAVKNIDFGVKKVLVLFWRCVAESLAR